LSKGGCLRGQALVVQLSDFGLGRGLNLGKALELLGLDVSLLTNTPIYGGTAQARNQDYSSFDGQVMSFTIPYARSLYTHLFGRLIVYVAFMFFSFIKVMSMPTKPSIVISRGPQPFAEIASVAYARVYPNVVLISDTTDLWPDALLYMGRPTLGTRLIMALGTAINKVVYRSFDEVTTHNDLMQDVLRSRFSKPTSVIMGAIDLDVYKPIGRSVAADAMPANLRVQIQRKFVVLYAGLLGPFQAPMKIVNLAESLKTEMDVVFLIAGEGPEKDSMVKAVSELGLENVVFLGTRASGEMPMIYNLADVFLFTYADLGFLKIGLPKKFIEYSSSGRPILCLTPACIASSLCETWHAGAHFLPADFRGAAEFVKVLKTDESLRIEMGENAREMAFKLFSLENASGLLKEVILSNLLRNSA
jgi:colanic acid biosynthesis glycosyl transferase WcaI